MPMKFRPAQWMMLVTTALLLGVIGLIIYGNSLAFLVRALFFRWESVRFFTRIVTLNLREFRAMKGLIF